MGDRAGDRAVAPGWEVQPQRRQRGHRGTGCSARSEGRAVPSLVTHKTNPPMSPGERLLLQTAPLNPPEVASWGASALAGPAHITARPSGEVCSAPRNIWGFCTRVSAGWSCRRALGTGGDLVGMAPPPCSPSTSPCFPWVLHHGVSSGFPSPWSRCRARREQAMPRSPAAVPQPCCPGENSLLCPSERLWGRRRVTVPSSVGAGGTSDPSSGCGRGEGE